MGETDAALVEDDQVAGGHDRPEQGGELFGERQRRLPGAAGERDDRAADFPDGRPVAADRESDRFRGAAARIRWHGEVTAGEVVAVAARRERDLRLRGGTAAAPSAQRPAVRSIAAIFPTDRGIDRNLVTSLPRRAALPADKVFSVSTERQIVEAPGAPAAVGPYSHAVLVAGELLFCSGQIPLDPATGELVGRTPAEQARCCLENLRAVCEAAGASLERAVRLTIYMTDLDAFAEVNEVYATFFSSEPPARVTVGVAQLPKGAQVEIDAVVAL